MYRGAEEIPPLFQEDRTMQVSERFLKYVAFDTQSDENSPTCPSTDKQRVLGAALVKEMQEMGILDAYMDENGYVYGTVPGDPALPTIGLIAHMDTSPDASGTGIRARTVYCDGEDILLNPEKDIWLKASEYETLRLHKGKHLIVTDGTTLLGADDKAGIAEIMTAAEMLLQSNLPHATLKIGFTPDEEIGRGADRFNLKDFGADYAYTVDGGDVGEIEYENFNAASAVVTVHGRSVHPGSAKNTMLNAQNVAMEFHMALPKFDRPEHTEGREGFYHLTDMIGDVTFAKLQYIVRDHDEAKFQAKKELILHTAACLNEQYGASVVEVDLKDSYANMIEQIRPHFHLIEFAKEAVKQAGLVPVECPIRGGTDGARLSYEGLPCPNLGTGGFNFHGPYECITVEKMDQSVEVLLNIIALFTK